MDDSDSSSDDDLEFGDIMEDDRPEVNFFQQCISRMQKDRGSQFSQEKSENFSSFIQFMRQFNQERRREEERDLNLVGRGDLLSNLLGEEKKDDAVSSYNLGKYLTEDVKKFGNVHSVFLGKMKVLRINRINQIEKFNKLLGNKTQKKIVWKFSGSSQEGIRESHLFRMEWNEVFQFIDHEFSGLIPVEDGRKVWEEICVNERLRDFSFFQSLQNVCSNLGMKNEWMDQNLDVFNICRETTKKDVNIERMKLSNLLKLFFVFLSFPGKVNCFRLVDSFILSVSFVKNLGNQFLGFLYFLLLLTKSLDVEIFDFDQISRSSYVKYLTQEVNRSLQQKQ